MKVGIISCWMMAAALMPAGFVLAQQTAPATAPSTAPATTPARGSNPLATTARGRASPPEGAGRTSPDAAAAGGVRGRGTSRSGGRGSRGPQVPIATEGPTSSFTATIYQVHVSVAQISRVEVDALTTAAGTPADFEKALAELGTVRPIYFVSQSVRIAGDSIQMGSSSPYVTNSQVSRSGATVNSVAYTNVGAIFEMKGTVAANRSINLDLSIDLSVLADGGVAVSNNVNAPNFRSMTLSRKGPVQPQKAFVALNVDASVRDANNRAVAYVARVVMGEPEN